MIFLNGDGAANEVGYWEEVDALLGWWEAAGEPNSDNGKEYVELLCELDAVEAGTRTLEVEDEAEETIRGGQRRGEDSDEDLDFGGRFAACESNLWPEVARAMASWRKDVGNRIRRRRAWQMARERDLARVFRKWQDSHERQELSKAAYLAAMVSMGMILAGEAKKSELWASIMQKARRKRKKQRKKTRVLRKIRQAESQGDAASEPGGQWEAERRAKGLLGLGQREYSTMAAMRRWWGRCWGQVLMEKANRFWGKRGRKRALLWAQRRWAMNAAIAKERAEKSKARARKQFKKRDMMMPAPRELPRETMSRLQHWELSGEPLATQRALARSGDPSSWTAKKKTLLTRMLESAVMVMMEERGVLDTVGVTIEMMCGNDDHDQVWHAYAFTDYGYQFWPRMIEQYEKRGAPPKLPVCN